MGHPQPRTPIQTDNTTVDGVINKKIQPKCTKAMEMHFHWLRDREAQGQFRIYWRPGNTNLADYFMKHHPPAHHANVRAEFLTRVKDLTTSRYSGNQGQTNQIAVLQGCARQATKVKARTANLSNGENLNSPLIGFQRDNNQMKPINK